MPEAPLNYKELRQERQPIYQRIVRWMWILLGLGVFSGVMVFVILSFGDLPDTKELENPTSILASEVFAEGGEVLGRYYIENRVPVAYDDLSTNVVQALIATEDERYFQHSGIDLEALGRVLFKTALMGNSNYGGGSTISQQLAKLLFTERVASSRFKRAVQKLREWIIAVRLERQYTKEEILAMYLNKFDFLYDGDGIAAASEVYFGKPQKQLKVEEAAMLVGMLKNPSLYNPVSSTKRFRENARSRQTVVLKQMQLKNLLTQEEYDSLKQIELDIQLHRSTHNDGLAPHFRGRLWQELDDLLDQRENYKPDGTRYDLFRDGLRIYTTIDPVIQRHMEIAAIRHMAKIQKTFWKHWEVVDSDPWTYKNYETTKAELEARERTLIRMMRESDRYQHIREELLGDLVEKIIQDLDVSRLRDVDIERMLEEDAAKNENVLKLLVSQNMISSDMAKEYEKVMRSQYWPKLKKQWTLLQERAEKSFNTPTKMRVFSLEGITDETNVDSLFDEEALMLVMEKEVEMTPMDSLKYHHEFLQIGSIAVDPRSGEVKGWIGGVNYRYFKLDHVKTRRQVGSTFKPFVYATAIDKVGISPCYEIYDLPQTIYPGEGNFHLNKEWTPANSSGSYSGDLLNLKEGLRKSKNTVSVFLMKQLKDPEPVRDLVHLMGIDKNATYSNGRHVLPKTPSICLGATDLSVLEMTGAYTTFANRGWYQKPYFIKRIEDRSGRVIYKDEPVDREALDEKTNYVMLQMLKYAATGVHELKSEVGGKTGTTNDHVDGWFMGITPSLVVGTWVGGEERWIRFRSLQYGQGAYLAKPFFVDLMKRIEQDEATGYDVSARFSIPRGDIGIELDCSKYKTNQFEEQNPYDEFGEDMFGDEDLPAMDSTSFFFSPGSGRR